MAKTMIGVDIGNSFVKVAVNRRGGVETIFAQLPDNMVVGGRVQMPNSMADFLHGLWKNHHLPAHARCALVLPDSQCLCRRLSMPDMLESQLKLNLPYEFRDYILSEAEGYVYDYAVLHRVEPEEPLSEDAGAEEAPQTPKAEEPKKKKESILTRKIEMPFGKKKQTKTTVEQPEGEPEPEVTLDLLVAAVAQNIVDEYDEIFSGAGLKLRQILPREMVYTQMLRRYYADHPEEAGREICLMDIGYSSTRVHMFRGTDLVSSRAVDLGCGEIDRAIAEGMNCDAHLASGYKVNNYQDALHLPQVQDAYGRISVEIMKIINFYRFNNRESTLTDVYYLGGGAAIEPLCAAITEAIDLTPRDIQELMTEPVDNAASCMLTSELAVRD